MDSPADLARRLLLSLSAYEFQRSYWFGGLLVLVAVLVPALDLGGQAEWLSDVLAGRWVVFAALGALVAPALFTALSETAFWLTRKYGERDHAAVPRIMPSSPPTRSDVPPSPEANYLLPVPFRSGGFKQVFGAFFTREFKSHLFGYSPYSAWMKAKAGPKLQNARRGIFLARTGDSIDIEKIGKSYRAIRVCDGCWILDQIPVEDSPDA